MTTAKKAVESSAIESEVKDETTTAPKTFKFTFNGEEIELEDKWTRDGELPPLIALSSTDELAGRMITPITEQVIGVDQIIDLITRGLSQNEFVKVVAAWAESRGLKN